VEGASAAGVLGGDLLLSTPMGEIAFRLIEKEEMSVAASAAVREMEPGVFELAAPYVPAALPQQAAAEPRLPLLYSTYLGGTADDYGTIAVDRSGFVYITGQTDSLDFPTTPGAWSTVTSGHDAFIVKLNRSGTGLVYGTFIGRAAGQDIAVDSSGAAYITGITDSCDFPITEDAFDQEIEGCFGGQEIFVTKLNPEGTDLSFSTFLGGSMVEGEASVAVDASGHAYVHGFTNSEDFPVTPGSFDTSLDGGADAFVAKLNQRGSGLFYSTFLGGDQGEMSGEIALGASGGAYIAGVTYSADFPVTPGAADVTISDFSDAFVAKLNSAGSALDYATFLGGTGQEVELRIAVDAHGAAYVAGLTSAADFPVTPGAYDEILDSSDDFVAKLSPAGSSLEYATFLGGLSWEDLGGIAVDGAGAVYVTGLTNSPDFPVSRGALQSTYAGSEDGFLAKLDPTGSALLYGTFLGSSDRDQMSAVVLDRMENVFVGGVTRGSDFPVTEGAFDTQFNAGYDIVVIGLSASR
jgi:hypothetical protein